ncbi:LCP family protein required for cell wall assembly [Kineococcus xinjiangensis]|uniref:LCP family protein required for cell wall assembly n=2 Tax=Kineococcus xinjiangensis TaxID=512762 RepID=A0A2S6ITY8_9ACTN|nr:LCP family protein required for cell wall assembly [Kineococcus xinjiangensis]
MPRAAGTPRLDGPRPQGRGGHPPQPPAHGPAPQRPARPVATTVRRRRRPRPGRLLLLLAVLLVAYPVALGATAWAKVTEVSALPAASPADTPGTTFLVVGSDSRAGLDEAQRQELSTGNDEGHRTDTIMLLHVPDSGGPTALISIPRDSYVPIPGHGRNKINSSFSIGGPQLLVQTVEEVSGLRVDHYVETGFGGFARIVDAVGGVDMCVPSPVRDERAGLDLAAGCQTMDGPTALGFARYRYSDPLGDLGRVQRQRELLAAIMAKGASPATLANPLRAVPLASAGGSALVLDERATPWTLLTFARGMRAAASTAGISMTVPIGDPALRTPAGTAVKWDTERAVAMFEALKADDTEQLRALAG